MPFIDISYLHHILSHPKQFTTFIKLLTIFDTMKSWQPDYTKISSGQENCEQPDEVDHWDPVCPCVPVRLTMLLQCHNTTILDHYPPKIPKPANGSLFDLLPPDVLAAIDNWLTELKYHDKFKHVLLQFKYKINTFLYIIPYQYWNPYQKNHSSKCTSLPFTNGYSDLPICLRV